jgi:hypothetical protein
MVVITKPEDFLPRKLRVIIYDYGVWDPKTVYDVREEFHGFFRPDLHDRPGLYPLRELVYGDE